MEKLSVLENLSAFSAFSALLHCQEGGSDRVGSGRFGLEGSKSITVGHSVSKVGRELLILLQLKDGNKIISNYPPHHCFS